MGDINLSNFQNVLLYSLCVIVWCRENDTLWHIRTANAAQSILIFFFFEKIQKVRCEAIWSRDAAAQAEFSFWNLME